MVGGNNHQNNHMSPLQTAQIWEEVYHSLESYPMFPEDQKWCHKEIIGTSDLLYIDQHIVKEVKTKTRMAWSLKHG